VCYTGTTYGVKFFHENIATPVTLPYQHFFYVFFIILGMWSYYN